MAAGKRTTRGRSEEAGAPRPGKAEPPLANGGELPPRVRLPRRARRPSLGPVLIGGHDASQVLGRRVNALRVACGLSQEDLADRVGIDRTYVSEIERGRANPTLGVLLRLREVLGATLDALVELG